MPHYPTGPHGEKATVMEKALIEPEEYEEVKAASDVATTTTPTEWRSTRIDKCGKFTQAQVDALEAAGLRTLGGLQEAMANEPDWWSKNLKINGRHKQPIEDAFNDFLATVSQ